MLAVAELAARAADLAASADAPATRRAYAGDLRAWAAWCDSMGASPALPADPRLVLAWAVAMDASGLALASVRRRLAGLAAAHRERGLDAANSPDLARVLRGMRREQASTPRGRGAKRAMGASMIAAALPLLTPRDRAVLLVGAATGCRRSELAAMRWEHVRPSESGLVIVLGARKRSDSGQCVGVPRGPAGSLACPVAALRDLRREQGSPATGPVFGVSAETIATIVKRAAELAGEDGRDFGGHSLRAGLVTISSGAGVSLASIMQQSGHASATIAAGYCRHADASANPAPAAVVAAISRATIGGAS
jgi:integrase